MSEQIKYDRYLGLWYRQREDGLMCYFFTLLYAMDYDKFPEVFKCGPWITRERMMEGLGIKASDEKESK